MDGTIAIGAHIDFTSLGDNPTAAYMALAPYDIYTQSVWNKLCQTYDVYIATWRSFPNSRAEISEWLNLQGMDQPAGIICIDRSHKTLQEPNAIDWKVKIVQAIDPVGFFDDHPRIIKSAQESWSWTLTYKMYNPLFDGTTPSIEMISSWKQIGALFN